jgi:hypothetical protein
MPGVTVLGIETSASPARWALSANGRKEVARISETEQVIINVAFDSSRSDALAVSAHAPGVIVVAGPRTRAKDFDEALALLTAVAPLQLVAIIIERRGSRSLPRRLGRPRRSAITPSSSDAVTTSTPHVPSPSDEVKAEPAADERIGDGLSSAKH